MNPIDATPDETPAGAFNSPEIKAELSTPRTLSDPPTIHFTVHQTPAGYVPRPVINGSMTRDELITAIALRTGFPESEVTTICTGMFAEIDYQTSQGIKIPNVFDVISTEPGCKGIKTSPDQFRTASDIGSYILFRMRKLAVTGYQAGKSISSDGTFPMVMPRITSFVGGIIPTLNRYTMLAMAVLKGMGLKNFNLSASDEGVFCAPVGGGPEIRCVFYSGVTDRTFTITIPTGVTGPQIIIFRTRMGGSTLRTVVYSIHVLPYV